MSKLKLEIFRPRSRHVQIEVYSISHFRHQGFAESHAPVSILIFHDHAISVAASISRIVIRAVIVNGPIHKLKMTVATNGIDIEEVRQTELSGANFEAT